jgi:hypothetical protein
MPLPTLSELTYFDLAIAFLFAMLLLRGVWIGFV